MTTLSGINEIDQSIHAEIHITAFHSGFASPKHDGNLCENLLIRIFNFYANDAYRRFSEQGLLSIHAK